MTLLPTDMSRFNLDDTTRQRGAANAKGCRLDSEAAEDREASRIARGRDGDSGNSRGASTRNRRCTGTAQSSTQPGSRDRGYKPSVPSSASIQVNPQPQQRQQSTRSRARSARRNRSVHFVDETEVFTIDPPRQEGTVGSRRRLAAITTNIPMPTSTLEQKLNERQRQLDEREHDLNQRSKLQSETAEQLNDELVQRLLELRLREEEVRSTGSRERMGSRDGRRPHQNDRRAPDIGNQTGRGLDSYMDSDSDGLMVRAGDRERGYEYERRRPVKFEGSRFESDRVRQRDLPRHDIRWAEIYGVGGSGYVPRDVCQFSRRTKMRGKEGGVFYEVDADESRGLDGSKKDRVTITRWSRRGGRH